MEDARTCAFSFKMSRGGRYQKRLRRISVSTRATVGNRQRVLIALEACAGFSRFEGLFGDCKSLLAGCKGIQKSKMETPAILWWGECPLRVLESEAENAALTLTF